LKKKKGLSGKSTISMAEILETDEENCESESEDEDNEKYE
jgi:hypothetical protein